MEPRLILINLLVKLGVAAAVASTLVRSVEFKSLLFREERSTRQKRVQSTRMIARITFLMPVPSPTISTSDRITGGNDIQTSTALLISQSTVPPQ